MARIGFKRWFTKFAPAAIERSTFVLRCTAILILLVWQWRPLPGSVWHVEGGAATALQLVSGIGWASCCCRPS